MSHIEEKTILDLNDDCLAAIFQYLDFEDLVDLKEATTAFHEGISLSLKTPKVISLRSFDSEDTAISFFRDIPFQIRKLDMALFHEIDEGSRNEYLSNVLNEIDLSNVTHLTMNGFEFENSLFLKEILSTFRNVRSITFDNTKIKEIIIWLELIEAERIEELTLIKARLCPDEPFPDNNMLESSGFYKLLAKLRKHASSLRVFQFYGLCFRERKIEINFLYNILAVFKQRLIEILSECAPNLEVLTLHPVFDYDT